jgi:hypothetical protein
VSPPWAYLARCHHLRFAGIHLETQGQDMPKDRSKTSPKKAPKNTGDEDQNAVGTQQVTASAIESSTQGNSDVDGSLSSITSKPSHRRQNPPAAGLHIVATPIGNASDITLRALDILAQADMIACEDTRVTRKLLSIHGLDTHRLISYHEHNAESAGPKIMGALNSGKIVAQVSDAGTPRLSLGATVSRCRHLGACGTRRICGDRSLGLGWAADRPVYVLRLSAAKICTPANLVGRTASY